MIFVASIKRAIRPPRQARDFQQAHSPERSRRAVEFSILDVRFSFDVGRSMFDVGRSSFLSPQTLNNEP